jgi:hypothetical protein
MSGTALGSDVYGERRSTAPKQRTRAVKHTLRRTAHRRTQSVRRHRADEPRLSKSDEDPWPPPRCDVTAGRGGPRSPPPFASSLSVAAQPDGGSGAPYVLGLM